MPFTKKTTVTAEASSTGERPPAKDLQYYQGLSRKARTRLEAVNKQLTESKGEYERVSQESVNDDQLDVTAIALCQQTIAGLEQAVRVALKQESEAGEQLRLAEAESRREILRKELVQLGIEGQDVQETMDTLTAKVARLAARMNTVRALGFDSINVQLTNAGLAFKPRLLQACRPMPYCAVAEAWFLRDEPWVESLPKPDQANQAKCA